MMWCKAPGTFNRAYRGMVAPASDAQAVCLSMLMHIPRQSGTQRLQQRPLCFHMSYQLLISKKDIISVDLQ